jgi:hypothetical protein
MLTVIVTATILVLSCVILHLGVLQAISALILRLRGLTRLRVGIVILGAILGHLLEIGVFAIGFGLLGTHGELGSLTGGIEEARNAFYYSAVTFTSLGYGDIVPVGSLRILSAVEALTGLVLITWTASYTFLVMERMWLQQVPGSTPRTAPAPR